MAFLTVFLTFLLPVFLLAQDCEESVTTKNGKAVCKGEVIFEDDFNTLDLNTWKRTVRLNTEDGDFAVYNDNSTLSFVSDGRLIITQKLFDDDFVQKGSIKLAHCTESKPELCKMESKFAYLIPGVQTAQLCTKDSFNFKYGTVDVSAKLPSGDWVAPQIWLKPTEEFYGSEYRSGKIRIAMARGNHILTSSTNEEYGSIVLESGIMLGSNITNLVKARSVIATANHPWTSKLHQFTLIWKPDGISFVYDKKKERETHIFSKTEVKKLSQVIGINEKTWNHGSKIAPFDREFHICVGLSVGNNFYFPDKTNSDGYEKPWKNLHPQGSKLFWDGKSNWYPTWGVGTRLEIDSIKVTAL